LAAAWSGSGCRRRSSSPTTTCGASTRWCPATARWRSSIARTTRTCSWSASTTILKFFLHISPEEQLERFRERYEDPTKRWKFKVGDLEERKRWDDYTVAYEDMLERCSTDDAPWYVIPANRKWFRNLAVAEILADTLDDLKPRYPEPAEDLAGVVVE